MFDFSVFSLTTADWLSYGGVLFLAVMAKVLRAETRVLTLGVVACVLVPSGATPYVVVSIALVLRFLDMWKL